MALFPVRSMLLCQHTQLHLHLASAVQHCFVYCMLLSIPWVPRKRRHHMAQQSRLSRSGESNIALHSRLSSIYLHRHKVSSCIQDLDNPKYECADIFIRMLDCDSPLCAHYHISSQPEHSCLVAGYVCIGIWLANTSNALQTSSGNCFIGR